MIEVLLTIRDCLQRNEKSSESTQVIEIRNVLITLHEKLKKLKLTPPSIGGDISTYLKSFEQWLLDKVRNISQGVF